MSNSLIRPQKLPVDYLASALTDAQLGRSISGNTLLHAIEQSIRRRLPENVRGLVRQATIPAVKTRGRPPNFGAARDFEMLTVDRCYPRLLRRYKNERRMQKAAAKEKGISLPRIEQSASELAYRFILKHRSVIFGNIDWCALRNMHSQWKHGRFHSSNGEVDSEDFDAEIERRFPSKR